MVPGYSTGASNSVDDSARVCNEESPLRTPTAACFSRGCVSFQSWRMDRTLIDSTGATGELPLNADVASTTRSSTTIAPRGQRSESA